MQNTLSSLNNLFKSIGNFNSQALFLLWIIIFVAVVISGGNILRPNSELPPPEEIIARSFEAKTQFEDRLNSGTGSQIAEIPNYNCRFNFYKADVLADTNLSPQFATDKAREEYTKFTTASPIKRESISIDLSLEPETTENCMDSELIWFSADSTNFLVPKLALASNAVLTLENIPELDSKIAISFSPFSGTTNVFELEPQDSYLVSSGRTYFGNDVLNFGENSILQFNGANFDKSQNSRQNLSQNIIAHQEINNIPNIEANETWYFIAPTNTNSEENLEIQKEIEEFENSNEIFGNIKNTVSLKNPKEILLLPRLENYNSAVSKSLIQKENIIDTHQAKVISGILNTETSGISFSYAPLGKEEINPAEFPDFSEADQTPIPHIEIYKWSLENLLPQTEIIN